MSPDNKKIYQKARAKWGMFSQLAAAVEELSELSVELCKLMNGKRNEQDLDDRKLIIDELADAKIMVEQTIYNLDLEKEVDVRMAIKLKKLDRRLS